MHPTVTDAARIEQIGKQDWGSGGEVLRARHRIDRRRAAVLCTLSLLSVAALMPAARADAVAGAIAHPSLWPGRLDSLEGFDRASRAVLIEYATALDDAERMSSAELQGALAAKSFDAGSVAHWLDNERRRVMLNYQRASNGCKPKDWTCRAETASVAALAAVGHSLPAAAPPEFRRWHEDLATFAKNFALEQLRLAAVFPAANNETDIFSDIEWTGESLPDRTFVLTFDDGPTSAGGTTDQTLALLEALHKSAAFFLLGVHLETRVANDGAAAVAALYGHQCVASHGWEHHSHATWADWQGSVMRAKALLSATFAPSEVLPLFRPPNGQRRPDSRAFFAAQSLHVALWNIDAYDWNSSFDGDAVAGRVITLILLRRHGVALFHDIYGNALTALPKVFASLGRVIDWPDCHQLARL
jgi:peptidoglycan/xylan/chitin deacetylase (PgdA/CDA1 family)